MKFCKYCGKKIEGDFCHCKKNKINNPNLFKEEDKKNKEKQEKNKKKVKDTIKIIKDKSYFKINSIKNKACIIKSKISLKYIIISGCSLLGVIILIVVINTISNATNFSSDYLKYMKLKEGEYILDVNTKELEITLESEDGNIKYKILDENNKEVKVKEKKIDNKVIISTKNNNDGKTYTLEIEKGKIASEEISDASKIVYSFKEESSNKKVALKYLLNHSRNFVSDKYEEDRYYYKGEDVDNYLKFNNEIWRIMSVEKNGTVKIIRDDPVGLFSYEEDYFLTFERALNENNSYCSYSGCNAITTFDNEDIAKKIYGIKTGGIVKDEAYIVKKLNEEYYLGKYDVCVAYNSKNEKIESYEMSKEECKEAELYRDYFLTNDDYYKGTSDCKKVKTTFLYSGLTDEARKDVVLTTFNIGAIENLTTIEEGIKSEKQFGWDAYVGLMSATDFVRASLSVKCTHFDSVENTSSSGCASGNYLSKNEKITALTITPFYGYESLLWTPTEHLFTARYANKKKSIYPVLSLRSSIVLKGEGTEENPFEVVK